MLQITEVNTHIQLLRQGLHLLLEFLHDVVASLLSSRYIDSFRCTSGHRNHILECGMIECANRLENESNMRKRASKTIHAYLVSFNQPLDSCISKELLTEWL